MNYTKPHTESRIFSPYFSLFFPLLASKQVYIWDSRLDRDFVLSVPVTTFNGPSNRIQKYFFNQENAKKSTRRDNMHYNQ